MPEVDMLEIRQDGDRILTQKAKRVANVDDAIRNICCSMIQTMHSANGVGLSGNQVGILKRIIVFLDGQEERVMINPEIINASLEMSTFMEGCLSFPEMYLDIRRPKTITVKYKNTKGKPHIEQFSDFTARVIQHEIDHLDGIVFTERSQTA